MQGEGSKRRGAGITSWRCARCPAPAAAPAAHVRHGCCGPPGSGPARWPAAAPAHPGAEQAACYRYLDGMEGLLQRLATGGAEVHAFSNYPAWWQLIEGKLELSRYLRWTFVSCQGPMKARLAAAAWGRALAVCMGRPCHRAARAALSSPSPGSGPRAGAGHSMLAPTPFCALPAAWGASAC